MLRYMLDTDTISYAMRGIGRVADRLRKLRPSAVCISALTLAELRYGAEKRRSRKLTADIDTIAGALIVAPFDRLAAERFGVVAAHLASHGTPIGALDALIASHALSLRVAIVTNNVRHYAAVPGLRVENWT